ncbi:MAG: glycosyltransferase family 39 protein [Candidatus Aureabacteria bacterium]|nr:glycosyltransferase family 39 protein [Candidatus Auribacterota bacterium]
MDQAKEPSGPLHLLLSACLFFIFFLQCAFSMAGKSPTYDEVVHAPAGMTEILTGSHRLVNDHPPLFRYLLALPLFFHQPHVPFASEAWTTKDPVDRRYDFGRKFFFGSGNDADDLLFTSRLVVVIFSLFLGILVLSFSTLVFGRWAGLFSLFIFVFDPNVLAHARIAKNDMFLTVFLFMTFYQLYLTIRENSTKNLLLLGLVYGMALATKYSALAVLPIILFLLWRFQGGGREKKIKRIFTAFAQCLMICLLGAIVLFCSYILFDGQVKEYRKAFSEQQDLVKEYTLVQQAKNLWKGLTGGMRHLEEGHHAYFMGKMKKTSWLGYFPLAFLIKNPLPLLAFFLFAVLIFLFEKRDKKEIHVFLISIVVIFFLFLVFFSLNLGYRYMLPLHPLLAVYCGVIVAFIKERKKAMLTAVFFLLCTWYAAGSLRIYPDYLAYFNEAAGGPDRGSEYLVDSNLDWGQDLKGLKVYMDEEGLDWIYLVYFGQDDPLYRKIRFSPDLTSFSLRPGGRDVIEKAFVTAAEAYVKEKPGYFAISATHLRGVYLDNPEFFKYLWDKRPVANIGHSIFIYRIL